MSTLTEGWKEFYSPRAQAPYYVNGTTGTSSPTTSTLCRRNTQLRTLMQVFSTGPGPLRVASPALNRKRNMNTAVNRIRKSSHFSQSSWSANQCNMFIERTTVGAAAPRPPPPLRAAPLLRDAQGLPPTTAAGAAGGAALLRATPSLRDVGSLLPATIGAAAPRIAFSTGQIFPHKLPYVVCMCPCKLCARRIAFVCSILPDTRLPVQILVRWSRLKRQLPKARDVGFSPTVNSASVSTFWLQWERSLVAAFPLTSFLPLRAVVR